MQLPLVLALLICDDVWIDHNTRKQTVLGIYGSIAATEFPHSLPQMAVYLCLTECPPSCMVRVRIVDLDEQRAPVFDHTHSIASPDPRATHQGAVRIRGVVFPEPGEYRVQLHADGEFLLERRLLVLELGSGHAAD